MGVYPAFVAELNPIPKENELIWTNGKILEAKNTQPNLTVELSNSTVQKMNFPVSLYLSSLKGSPKFFGIRSNKLAELKGCSVALATKEISWKIGNQSYIWDMRSPCGDFTYDQATTYFKRFEEFSWLVAVFHTFVLSLLVFTWRFERNKK